MANGSTAGDPVTAQTYQSGAASAVANTTTSYTTGTWYYATAVFATVSSRAAYIDGGSVGTNTTSRTPDSLSHTAIGTLYRSDDPGVYTSGYIDEVRISNTPRTAEWISTTYNNQMFPSDFYDPGTQTAETAYNINIAGNFSNSGTFTVNEGTVTFDGSGTSTISLFKQFL